MRQRFQLNQEFLSAEEQSSKSVVYAFIWFRNKFVEFDMKPVCKKCYEKFPLELKKRLKKLAETLGRK